MGSRSWNTAKPQKAVVRERRQQHGPGVGILQHIHAGADSVAVSAADHRGLAQPQFDFTCGYRQRGDCADATGAGDLCVDGAGDSRARHGRFVDRTPDGFHQRDPGGAQRHGGAGVAGVLLFVRDCGGCCLPVADGADHCLCAGAAHHRGAQWVPGLVRHQFGDTAAPRRYGAGVDVFLGSWHHLGFPDSGHSGAQHSRMAGLYQHRFLWTPAADGLRRTCRLYQRGSYHHCPPGCALYCRCFCSAGSAHLHRADRIG